MYMAKNNSGKRITIDNLAVMVQKGFSEQSETLNKRFDKIEKDLTIIKGQLVDVVHRSDFDKLENRVEYLENILNLPAKKH